MEECSICLDELVGSIVILKCTHKYHDICIGTWYESNIKNNTNFVCPQCNTVTDIETIINVEPDTQNNIEMNPLFINNHNISSDRPNIGNDNSNIGNNNSNIGNNNSNIGNDSPNIGNNNSNIENNNSNIGNDSDNIGNDSPNMVDEGKRINMCSDGSNRTSESLNVVDDSLNMVNDTQLVRYTPLNMRNRNTNIPRTITNMEQELEQDDITINKNKCIRCCIS